MGVKKMGVSKKDGKKMGVRVKCQSATLALYSDPGYPFVNQERMLKVMAVNSPLVLN